MGKNDSLFPFADAQGRIECKEVLGGIRNKDIEVSAGKIIASIYSAACCGGRGGDIYYFGVCKGDIISRLAVADVTGHGQAVSNISRCIYETLNAYMWEPDSRVILDKVNQLICNQSPDAITTAAVVACHRQEREVRISYAGHPPVLYKKASENAWSFVRPEKLQGPSDGFPLNLPLATGARTRYTQLTVPMGLGDRFFVYTDGIIDAPNSEGKPFRLSRLKDVLDENSDVPLSGLKSAVLKRLDQYTENELNHDDVTLIALEIH